MRDDQSDDISLDTDDELSLAVATADDAPEVAEPEWSGRCCEKCHAPLKSDTVAICRKCGWYASLGTFVEVDPNWELVTDSTTPAAKSEPKSTLKVWVELLPRWSWVMIASVAAIIVESVIARFATGGSLRTTWSLTQLASGILAFICCHIYNFLVLSSDDADVGVIDLVLKPLKLWMRAGQLLPTRLWVSNSALCGVTAAVMSLLVIGGLPYERLWDWGFEPPAKQDLMAAVMDRAREVKAKDQSLEDAVKDLAGDAVADETPPPPKPRAKADCVILGYQPDKDGRPGDLVLGTNYLGSLLYAGRVTPQMSAEDLEHLHKLLKAIRSSRPLIAIESDTTQWVKPHLACRVSYGERDKGRLHDILWERLLGRIGNQ